MKKTNSLSLIALLMCCLAWPSASVFGQAAGKKPELVMYFHNGGPQGALPALDGDTIGRIKYNALAAPGTMRNGASILSFLEGAPDAFSLPANLVFRTNGLYNRMVIKANGRVGIGTMAPLFDLDVVGNTHTSGRFHGRIHLDNDQAAFDNAPGTYTDEAYFERKQRSVLGVAPGLGNDFGAVLTLASGAGNDDHQLFFGDDGIYNRHFSPNAPTWGAAPWDKLLTSADIHGTENFISKFTGPSALGDSRLFDDGTSIGIGVGNAPDGAFLLTVGGATRLNGDLRATGGADIDGNANVDGALEVGTNANVNGSLDVDANANVDGTLDVGANANVGGSLDVDLNANVDGALNVEGSGRVDGILVVGDPSSTPGSHELYVNGSIIAEEVVVKLQGNWPDYVFAENYPTPNLAEWEQFILENKHLPGLPSAAEVEQNGGFEIGETQRLLLEKIEQLTLIVIEQQKQIDALNAALLNAKH